MIGVDSLRFDLAGCSLKQQSPTHRGWMSDAGVAHMLRVNEPVPWDFDLRHPNKCAAFFQAQAIENGGAMLSMELTKIAGVDALQGLFKYRAPVPGSLAMYYVGIVWVPFATCCFQINVEAMEHGPTGVREAAVALLENAAPATDTTPAERVTGAELFERLRSAPVRELPSDDARHDASFPSHPLSLVRERLPIVIGSARLHEDARRLKPFRRDSR